MKTTLTTLLAAACLAAAPVFAAPPALDQGIQEIQQQWEHINYELPEKRRADAFELLEKQADALAKQFPDRAEPLVWEGIVYSSHAGAKGGLGALGLAKEARRLLQAAEKIDPAALHGSIYGSLGTLYHKVPGWPIGFGDDDKAQTYLQKALQINPTGIDPNYFYAEYLFDKRRYAEALQVVERVQNAPPRPDRPLADKGRQQEVRALKAKIQAKAGD